MFLANWPLCFVKITSRMNVHWLEMLINWWKSWIINFVEGSIKVKTYSIDKLPKCLMIFCMLWNNSSTYKYDIMYKKSLKKKAWDGFFFFFALLFQSFTSFFFKKFNLGLKIFTNWKKNKREICSKLPKSIWTHESFRRA